MVWHAHMLSPIDYFPDCERLAGRVLDHNDSAPTAELEKSFEKTQALWQKQTKQAMVRKQKVKKKERENRAECSSCASCGFGDSFFHESQPHQAIESLQISEVEAAGDTSTFIDADLSPPSSSIFDSPIEQPTMWTEEPEISEQSDNSWWDFSWNFFKSSGDSSSGSSENSSGGVAVVAVVAVVVVETDP
eukprot:CAMPEP_0206189934 /NCGR_PEP_ID=MMETSP0166-20121206/4450_1 /ASSEMBLY_ACC=CAM_ASM_000260 /TAXON_ID=95228 /ORGANISM="Vannella robusta, Strain DIVA3 518/3/11/1/6" /LENGTH=189 /DNA_ID=CAMNT_0053605917 /DNA_START=1 /DNA_END=567 /DNA_ORIENTATION=-